MTRSRLSQPDLLTLREAADYLRVSMKTAYGLADRGTLPAVKVGGRWRIQRAELEQSTRRSPSERSR